MKNCNSYEYDMYASPEHIYINNAPSTLKSNKEDVYVSPKHKKVKILNVRVSPELFEAYRQYVETNMLNGSAFLRHILKKALMQNT